MFSLIKYTCTTLFVIVIVLGVDTLYYLMWEGPVEVYTYDNVYKFSQIMKHVG